MSIIVLYVLYTYIYLQNIYLLLRFIFIQFSNERW